MEITFFTGEKLIVLWRSLSVLGRNFLYYGDHFLYRGETFCTTEITFCIWGRLFVLRRSLSVQIIPDHMDVLPPFTHMSPKVKDMSGFSGIRCIWAP